MGPEWGNWRDDGTMRPSSFSIPSPCPDCDFFTPGILTEPTAWPIFRTSSGLEMMPRYPMHNPIHTDADTVDFEDAADTIVEEKPEVGLELHVGSNIFRTTNGVMKLQGKEQIVLEVQPDPPALLLTMDFYDEQGQRIGHLRRNQLSAAGSQRFAVCATSPPDPTLDDPLTVTVSERSTGSPIVEVYL